MLALAVYLDVARRVVPDEEPARAPGDPQRLAGKGESALDGVCRPVQDQHGSAAVISYQQITSWGQRQPCRRSQGLRLRGQGRQDGQP